METNNHLFPWLELMDRPAFCVKDGIVIEVNSAAAHRLLQPGTDIRQIVTKHREEYENFDSGCLYLTITIGELPCSASITRTRECDIFVLQQDADRDQLQTLALAAQHLRIPLSNVMTVADRLLADLDDSESETRQQAGQINRGLFQLLRIVSNMSASANHHSEPFVGMQLANFTAIFREIMEKAQTISQNTDIALHYTGPEMPVLGLADSEKLERAVYNLLSNALKFAPKNTAVDAKLYADENHLTFTISNLNEEPIPEHNFWSRYRREPAIEDSRYGLGLGMTLVSSVAAAHGGTVLIDHPGDRQTRVTMTLSLVKNAPGSIRSQILPIGDYAGGRDKALLEFADILPTDSYKNIN